MASPKGRPIGTSLLATRSWLAPGRNSQSVATTVASVGPYVLIRRAGRAMRCVRVPLSYVLGQHFLTADDHQAHRRWQGQPFLSNASTNSCQNAVGRSNTLIARSVHSRTNPCIDSTVRSLRNTSVPPHVRVRKISSTLASKLNEAN